MSVSCDGVNGFFRRALPTARKEHRCIACRMPIRVGQQYASEVYQWEGAVHTDKRCLGCQAIYAHLLSACDADTTVDPRLNCGHTYEEVHDCEPPEEIAALAFYLPGDPLPIELEAK